MAQYKLAHIDMKGNRGELHDLLNLTGAEVSCNTLPAGASVPFVHHHTQNEEVYLILEGKGMLYIDGAEVPGIASVLTRRGNVACARRTTAPCVSSVFRPRRAALKASP